MKHHFTASVVVICLNHVLLVLHKRIGAWLPPGGHIEEEEMPHVAAIREVKEETALDVEIINNESDLTRTMPGIAAKADKEAFFLPKPLLLQAVAAFENNISLYHIDFVYLARPVYKRSAHLPPRLLRCIDASLRIPNSESSTALFSENPLDKRPAHRPDGSLHLSGAHLRMGDAWRRRFMPSFDSQSDNSSLESSALQFPDYPLPALKPNIKHVQDARWVKLSQLNSLNLAKNVADIISQANSCLATINDLKRNENKPNYLSREDIRR